MSQFLYHVVCLIPLVGAPSFSKSIKLGAVDVSIQSFEVNYSKNTMKCGIKFEVAQEGGGGYDSDMGYYGGRRMW